MISFRTVDGTTFIRVDDAIAYESARYKSSLAKQRRGKGAKDVFVAIKANLNRLKSYKKRGYVLL